MEAIVSHHVPLPRGVLLNIHMSLFVALDLFEAQRNRLAIADFFEAGQRRPVFVCVRERSLLVIVGDDVGAVLGGLPSRTARPTSMTIRVPPLQ